MAITLNVPYYVLTADDYDFLNEINSTLVKDFFEFEINGQSYWFALQSDILGDEYPDIISEIGELNLGEAWFTNSVQANVYFPGQN